MSRFGFIIHPLDAKRDIARRYPVAKLLPTPAIEWFLKRSKPMALSEIEGIESATGATTTGCFVGCPLTPRMMMRMPTEEAYRIIGESVEAAARDGAEIVGLGAFTSVVGDGGVTVANNASVAVTSGNSYTVATAIEGALRAASEMAIVPSQARLAVVGATGSIGRTCAEILAPQFGGTVLIGRDLERTKAVAAEMACDNVTASADVAHGLADADVVISVTSAASAIIQPSYLKSGAVVCDVARPRDVSRRVAYERQDVLVVEGGVVAVPGKVDFGFDFGFPPGMAFACMCETMILALENRLERYSLGKHVSVAQVQEISALAEKHGFRLAGFRSFERAISGDEIRRIAANAKLHREASG